LRADRITGRIPALGVALATFLFAFLVRIANFQSAFVNGVPQFPPFDEMYHAKRIAYSASHPLRSLNFDVNRGVHGAFCPWPPLYDTVAGATGRLVGGSTPVGALVVASWLPPITAASVAAVIALALTTQIGLFAGLLGGLGVATSTFFIDRSRLVAIDHHFLEFPLVLGILLATFVISSARDRRDAVRSAAISAIAIVLALLVQTALLIAVAIAFGAVLVLDRRLAMSRTAAASGFAVAGLIVLLYRLQQPPAYPDKQWYLGVPHAAALAGAAVALVCQAWAFQRGTSFGVGTALALTMGVLTVVAFPNAFAAIVEGSHFLGGDPWLRSINEFHPLFFGEESLWAADLAFLGGGSLLTVGAMISPLWRSGTRFQLALFALGFSALAVTSMRFLAISAPLCAISGAVAVHDLRKRRPARVAFAVIVLLLPSLVLSAGRVIRPAPSITHDMVPMIRVAEYLQQQPAGGRVLGPWSWGHLFNVVANRGVLLDNFGTMGGQTDFENARGIILSTREKAVADYCRAHGVRYVVLQDPRPYFAGHAEMSGFPRAAFELNSSPTRLMKATFWWRAYFEGGRKRAGVGPAGEEFRSFRLVRTEREPGPSDVLSAVQVWELVPEP
jgi:asparagine N-glycosylation enzyme membrane subunit Stt3